MSFRQEKDSFGYIDVPSDRYWAAQTQRSLTNFKIGDERMKMPHEIIWAFAVLKKAAALANFDCGVLSKEKCDSIADACDEIMAGKWNNEFPLVVWQTGSGTQSNMNVNEVISAYRAHVRFWAAILADEKKLIHPNDDVNKSQSSNDTFPTAMHIAAYKMVVETTLPGIKTLRDTLNAKSEVRWRTL